MNSIVQVGRDRTRPSRDPDSIRIDYVNYRGEQNLRRIVPERIYFGEVEWHLGTQWILDAWDVDKGAWRSFAMKDIRGWDV